MVKAYAASKAGGLLEAFEYELGPMGPHEVDITVDHCGICHSDLSMLDNEWGLSQYPLVPGHEVSGRVAAVGELVTQLAVGDRVGLGWHSGYCMHCRQCMGGDHNLCPQASATIVGRHGGFADTVRAAAASVIKLPDGLDCKDAGPLLCGGITVFNPLVQYEVSPTGRVGVVGIGGLGHLALQFCAAWGCEVTAFTSSESKIEEAKRLGAHDTIDSRDPEAIKAAAGRFDLIISTVNVPLKWNDYLGTLAPKGRLHFVGAVLEPLKISAWPMIAAQRSVSGTPVGSPATIAMMLDFCVRHKIEPVTEHFPMAKLNDAMEHLRSGKARYRIVLDR